jgi:hypothetical protein
MLNVMVAENNTNDQYATLVDPATRQYKTSNEMSIEFEVDGPYKVDLPTQHHQEKATGLITFPQALLHSHDPSDNTEILSTRMVLRCVVLEALLYPCSQPSSVSILTMLRAHQSVALPFVCQAAGLFVEFQHALLCRAGHGAACQQRRRQADQEALCCLQL